MILHDKTSKIMNKTLIIKETYIYRIKDIDDVKVSDYDMSKPISIKELGIESIADIGDYDKYNELVFNKDYAYVLNKEDADFKSTEFEVFGKDEYGKQFAYENNYSHESDFVEIKS
jgi:hypothetical protein